MIYIQGPSGLQPISSQLTKENIIAALGYTPADNTVFYEDESGALAIVDEKGHVIARIDENGLTTIQVSANAIMLEGADLAAKLQELANKVPDIDLSNYYTKAEIDSALDNIDIPEVDLSEYALTTDVEANKVLTDAHAANADIHVKVSDKASWDAKSNFSGDYNDLINTPNIVNDNEDEVSICDSKGNVIFRATAEGINASGIYVNGVAVTVLPNFTAADEGKTLKIVNGTPTWVSE